MNYFVHADLGDWQKRLRFGRKIAPLEPWGAFGAEFAGDESQKTGGIIDVTMQAPRLDDLPGVVRVTLQPSNRIPDGTGIFIQVSDSIEIEQDAPADVSGNRHGNRAKLSKSKKQRSQPEPERRENVLSSAEFGNLFVQHFQDSIDRSRSTVDELVKTAVSS